MSDPTAKVSPLEVAKGVATADPWTILAQTNKLLEGTRDRDALLAETMERMVDAYEARDKLYLSAVETLPFKHDPTLDGGRSRVYMSKLLKGRLGGFSLSTLQTGAAAGGDNRDTTVYIRFDDVMPVIANYPDPSVYDLFVPLGGKLNQYQTQNYVNVITFYCRTAFEGVLFLTTGDPSRLPGL